MTDVLIRDVPKDVLTKFDDYCAEQGRSRTQQILFMMKQLMNKVK